MRTSMRDSFERAPAPGPIVAGPRRVANNTFEYVLEGGEARLRLHETDVVCVLPDGRLRLDSGGWLTYTTKERVNWWLQPRGYVLYSDRGLWYVEDAHERRAPFRDGMVLPDDLADDGRAREREFRALSREVNAYARGVRDLDPLPRPDPGDCWYCAMFQREPEVGPPGRDRDPTHLLEHVREGYYPGWLLVNALRWTGRTDRGVALILQMDNRDAVARAVRRYLRRRLGLPT